MLLEVVDEPAWRADKNIDPVRERLALLVVIDAAVDRERAKARELAKPLRFVEDLVRELAGGRNNEGLRGVPEVHDRITDHAGEE